MDVFVTLRIHEKYHYLLYTSPHGPHSPWLSLFGPRFLVGPRKQALSRDVGQSYEEE